jgi:uncharacterized membrane protein YesL
MDNNSGFMGALYTLSEWIMKFSITNLLWILFNLPIVYLLFTILFMEQLEVVFILLIPVILLMPFVFFPATTAMFAMVRDWIIKDEGINQLIKKYWGYYKENYKRSVGNGFLLTAAWVIWAADVYYFYEKNTAMMILFIIMGILLLVFSINLFSVTVHFHLKFSTSLKNALLLTIGSPILFIAVAMSSGLVIYVSFNVFRFIIPFLTGSLIAFLSFSAFYRNYLKLLAKKTE